jgi:hypothetical protein
MRILIPWLSLALVWFTAAAAPLHAATVQPMSIGELSQQAELIVIGRASESSSYWQDGRIFTRVAIQTEQVLHGPQQLPDTIFVILYGGTVLPYIQVVPGAPRLNRGERSLLFLYRHKSDWLIRGFSAGVVPLHPPDSPRSSVALPDTLAQLPNSIRHQQRQLPWPQLQQQIAEARHAR